jgi:8-oxo-dGTP pyrophosphatase MutT (NUDIX family)
MTEPLDIALTNVGAVIRLPDGRFLFQLRDDIPNIVMPGRWGFFGGHIEPGEDADTAIVRELEEEIAFRPRAVSRLTEIVYPRLNAEGRQVWIRRIFYDVPVSGAEVATMKLGEGADMRVMSGDEYLALPNIIYWEALAIAYIKGGGLAGERNMGRGLHERE